MPASATLTINENPDKPGEYYVIVKGKVADFPHPPQYAKVYVHMRGSDEWYDDDLFKFPNPPDLFSSSFDPGGETFTVASGSIAGSKLNEDWGEDEVYGEVNVTGFGPVRTNKITGHY